MSTEMKRTILDPITPENAVLLIIDQQEGLLSRISQPELTRANLLALARVSRMLGVPAVMTTVLAAGSNGPQLAGLGEIFANQPIIDRTLVDAWKEPRVKEAIMATGRKKVIIAGTGFEVCAQIPALSSAAEGYDTYVVLDACGLFSPSPSVAAISRLSQAGVALVDTRPLVLAMMADNAHPRAREIYATLPAGLVRMDSAS
ncbi:MAG: isochorismatase family protein [Ktedonobacteraceae bacterium]|nr:isochorismatase family protein [Ktedonobacteraceae bacterium]